MALSTVVFVGKAREWLPELVERAKKLKVSSGFENDADLGPLITCDAKERVERLITSGVKQGATLLLDGRSYQVILLHYALVVIIERTHALRKNSRPKITQRVTLSDLPF